MTVFRIMGMSARIAPHSRKSRRYARSLAVSSAISPDTASSPPRRSLYSSRRCSVSASICTSRASVSMASSASVSMRFLWRNWNCRVYRSNLITSALDTGVLVRRGAAPRAFRSRYKYLKYRARKPFSLTGLYVARLPRSRYVFRGGFGAGAGRAALRPSDRRSFSSLSV